MGSYDFRKYKESIITCAHLEAILKIIKLSMAGFKPFKAYTPVLKILTVLEDQKQIVELYYEKYKKIQKEKGKMG